MKVVAILWVVFNQLVYAARILSRVYIGSTDSHVNRFIHIFECCLRVLEYWCHIRCLHIGL